MTEPLADRLRESHEAGYQVEVVGRVVGAGHRVEHRPCCLPWLREPVDPPADRVHCAGSGCPPCAVTGADIDGTPIVMCSMCGLNAVIVDGVLPDHDRLDVLAMLARGDFDG